MKIKQHKKLHDLSTSISDGAVMDVDNLENLTISISGTSTSFSIQFTASIDGVNYFPIIADRMDDIAISSSTVNTISYGWSIDVSNVLYVKCKITAIANGNISVVAFAV